jgi:hypothetical protein
MSEVAGKKTNAGNVLSTIADLPGRLPGRVKRKIAGFDRTIARFRQRRWL